MGLSRRFCDKISERRRKNHQFNIGSRSVMAASREMGLSYRSIATSFRTDPATVWKIIKAFKERGNAAPKAHPGRPPKLNETERRYIIWLAKKDRKISYRSLLGAYNLLSNPISASTIYRILRKQWRRKWRSIRRIKLIEEAAR